MFSLVFFYYKYNIFSNKVFFKDNLIFLLYSYYRQILTAKCLTKTCFEYFLK